MIPLPPARNTWLCGEEWVNGEKVINPEKGCGQSICQSSTRKYKSGKGMVLNNETDMQKGGAYNDPHVCPNRVGSKFHHYKPIDKVEHERKLRHKLCGECLQEFDSIRCPLCPHCFKLECTKCHAMRQWINNERITVKVIKQGQYLNTWATSIDTSRPIIDNEVCNVCGHRSMDVRQIWNSYQRAYGKYDY